MKVGYMCIVHIVQWGLRVSECVQKIKRILEKLSVHVLNDQVDKILDFAASAEYNFIGNYQ